MAKYDRVEEPLRKAKEFERINEAKTISMETTLKSLNKQREFWASADRELLQFGIDLYNNNYTLEDVRNDLKLCEAMRDMNSDYDSNKSMIEYVGIERVPSYKKMLAIVDNPSLFKPIENGYNIAYRRNYAKKMDEKYDGMSR